MLVLKNIPRLLKKSRLLQITSPSVFLTHYVGATAKPHNFRQASGNIQLLTRNTNLGGQCRMNQ